MCARGWRSSAHRGRASSRRETSSANGWSATSTTAQQRLAGSRSRSGCCARSVPPPGAWRMQRRSCARRSASCASWRTAPSAVLADEGLAAAVEALAEDGAVPIRIGGLPDERLPAPVESTAYTVVAEAVRTATSAVAVTADRSRGRLAVDVETTILDGSTSSACRSRRRARRPARHRRARWTRHAASGAAVRVVIADDETLLREGLASLLSQAASTWSARSARATRCFGASSSHGRTWRS